MLKSFLLASILLFPAFAQTGIETFPGGEILFTDSGFVWESKDASGWIPSNVQRQTEGKIQTTSNPDFPLFLETYANDGHYELLPVSRAGALKLGKGLKKAGLVE